MKNSILVKTSNNLKDWATALLALCCDDNQARRDQEFAEFHAYLLDKSLKTGYIEVFGDATSKDVVDMLYLVAPCAIAVRQGKMTFDEAVQVLHNGGPEPQIDIDEGEDA